MRVFPVTSVNIPLIPGYECRLAPPTPVEVCGVCGVKTPLVILMGHQDFHNQCSIVSDGFSQDFRFAPELDLEMAVHYAMKQIGLAYLNKDKGPRLPPLWTTRNGVVRRFRPWLLPTGEQIASAIRETKHYQHLDSVLSSLQDTAFTDASDLA